MQDVNVLVVFCSGVEAIEQLALAAAVGAVQGRANIRLRRLPDQPDEAMNWEYVSPRDADAEWADAILVGAPPGELPPAFERYLAALNVGGKIGAVFTAGPGMDRLFAAMNRAGLTILAETIAAETTGADWPVASRLQGKRVAETARSLKSRGR
jgi:hypothetical protein